MFPCSTGCASEGPLGRLPHHSRGLGAGREPWVCVTMGCVLGARASHLCSQTHAGLGFPLENTSSFFQNPGHSYSRWSDVELLTFLGTVGHAVSLGASSFVEEEHQTWYFLVNTLCLTLCYEAYRTCFLGADGESPCCQHTEGGCDSAAPVRDGKACCDVLELSQAHRSPTSLDGPQGRDRWLVLASPWLTLTCCRLLRALNTTGVQGAHRPGLGHWLAR